MPATISTLGPRLVFWHHYQQGRIPRLSPLAENIQTELNRRHKAAATTVIGLVVGTILMGIIGYLSRGYFTVRTSPSLDIASRITMLILGLGSVAWRRNKFSALRLQDIGGLQGPEGVIKTLEKTTLQLSLLAVATVTIGFITTVLTGDEFYTYTGCGIGLLVLLYSYPKKTAWIKTVKRFGDPDSPPPPPSL